MNILAFERKQAEGLLAGTPLPWSPEQALPPTVWRPRAELEHDPNFLQVIPYAVLENPQGQIWAYRRSGGDNRLKGRCSIGVGGHVDAQDASHSFLETIQGALQRELAEELENPPKYFPEKPLAWIHESETPVGRVHLGLVWILPWTLTEAPKIMPAEALEAIGFIDPASIPGNPDFEIWSQLAVAALPAAS